MSGASLSALFEQVVDPRAASGRRYPLPAILTLTTVAMLSGARSLYAIAQFGRDRGPSFARALGFATGKTPCCSSLHYLFKALDGRAFESAIRRWLAGRADLRGSGWRAMSIDGKTLRGTQGDQLPGVHLLAAFAHEAKAAIGQMRVDAKTNEHKAALQLLELIDVEGAVVTGDAMFCQRDLSSKIKEKKGITSGRSRTISPNSKRPSPMRSRVNKTRRSRRVNVG